MRDFRYDWRMKYEGTRIKITSAHKFSCHPELVWDKLMDIDLLGSIIADGKGLKKVSPKKYKGKLPVNAGPLRGKLATTIMLKKQKKPERG